MSCGLLVGVSNPSIQITVSSLTTNVTQLGGQIIGYTGNFGAFSWPRVYQTTGGMSGVSCTCQNYNCSNACNQAYVAVSFFPNTTSISGNTVSYGLGNNFNWNWSIITVSGGVATHFSLFSSYSSFYNIVLQGSVSGTASLTQYFGLLGAFTNQTVSVTNVSSSVSVSLSGYFYAGGLFGVVNAQITISNVNISGSVSGYQAAGLIHTLSASKTASLTSVVVSGSVTASSWGGSLIVQALGSSTTTLSSITITGSLSATLYVGTIGYLGSSSHLSIATMTHSGSITGMQYTSTIVGYVDTSCVLSFASITSSGSI